MKYAPDLYPDLEINDEEAKQIEVFWSTSFLMIQEANKVRLVVSIISRSKRKSITTIDGTDALQQDMELDDLLKLFRNQFASGVNSPEPGTLQIQGDIGEEICDFLIDQFGVDPDDIYFDVEGKEVRARDTLYYFG